MYSLMNSENADYKKKNGNSKQDKPEAVVRVPYNNIRISEIPGKRFIEATLPTFIEVLYTTLPLTISKYPEKFPVATPIELIKMLQQDDIILGNEAVSSYDYFLKTEKYCLLFPENLTDKRMLRIDLHRLITPDEKDFSGELFHILDHFKIDGRNYIGNAKNEIQGFNSLIKLIAKACFFGKKKEPNGTSSIEMQIDNGSERFKVIFFRKKLTDHELFFLKSCYKIA